MKGGGGGWWCGWAESEAEKKGRRKEAERRSLDGSIKSSSLRDNSSRETGEGRGACDTCKNDGKKRRAEIEEICTWTKSLTREREWRERNTGDTVSYIGQRAVARDQ